MISRIISISLALVVLAFHLYVFFYTEEFPNQAKAMDTAHIPGRRLPTLVEWAYGFLPLLGCTLLIAPRLFLRLFPKRNTEPGATKVVEEAFLIIGYIIVFASILLYTPALKDLFGD